MTDPTKFPEQIGLLSHLDPLDIRGVIVYPRASSWPEHVEYIRADLVPTWRPIADMPDEYQDGRQLLLRGEGACIVAAYDGEWGEWCWSADGIHHHQDWPTHWMSLPEDPEGEA